jgi:SAM-dependent methyltransferase
MSLAERILTRLSRDPAAGDYPEPCTLGRRNVDTALSSLTRQFPGFGQLVAGQRVVDFGCGYGYQCLALATKYDCTVVGIDINPEGTSKGIAMARSMNVSESRLSFVDRATPAMKGTFDVAISHNSFEHFPNPESILDEMKDLVSPSGKILITFGAPWLSPYGSHMHFFTRVPWVNILFPEKAVMTVRSRYRDDGARRYEEVKSGLNKMTLARFERIVASSGLEVAFMRYRCVKNLDSLATVPLIRELFVNSVSAILVKAASPVPTASAPAIQRRQDRRIETVDVLHVSDLAGRADAHGPVDDHDRDRTR